MINIDKKVKVVHGCTPDQIPDDVLLSNEPLILKGLASSWPIVKAGFSSHEEVEKYLLQYYKGQEVAAFLGKPENNGRIFYDESMTGFNYDKVSTKLDFALKQLLLNANNPQPPSIYIGSTSVDDYLPGFRADNDLALGQHNPMVSIWISNKCRIAAHWDSPLNIACSVVGHRRFTLFPFDQMENLYVGPLDKTPAGQAISLVDFYNPDFKKYPKFKEALQHARIADLEPGDGIFIPSMWWHHVESLSSLNILVNYWFKWSPLFFGKPVNALFDAVLSIRDLPPEQRAAWKIIFDHYIFDYQKENFAYIPEQAQGAIGELTDDNARKIRARLLNQLNR
ncbi:cupin-like domain-containing protein [Cellvibrio mixtus]|uniref:cupin-like domain-containing protein n=1 Tax=Cellvibrio mixtus TaxID=39650 RepID=UPI0005879A5D|nr:cupin-like domain-containing protein [Cellvibrio mixtus]